MLANSVKPIFVVLDITEETLSGRTLGAEEPKLARRIMGEKLADIQKPMVEEKDVVLVNSMYDVDQVFTLIMEGIQKQVPKV